MIEHVMIFALGVLIAGLLGLMFLPAFWRRAVRLSARRFEMQLPLSMSEVAAERDLLRAEFAVDRRRLEQRMEQLDEARARDMSELGQRAKLLAAREDDIAKLRGDAVRMQSQIIQTQADAVETRAQLGAVLKDNYDLAPLREKNRMVALKAAQAESLADERRLVIAGLETRLAGLEMRLGDLQAERASQGAALLVSQTHADGVTYERDLARAEAASHATKIVAVEADLKERERQIAAMEAARADLLSAGATLKRELEESGRDVNARDRSLDTAAQQISDLQRELAGRDRQISEMEAARIELSRRLVAFEREAAETKEDLEEGDRAIAEASQQAAAISALARDLAARDRRISELDALRGESARRLEALERRLQESERDAETRSRALDGAAQQVTTIASLRRELADRDRRLSEMEESRRSAEQGAMRHAEEQAATAQQAVAAHRRESKLSADIEALTAEKGALQTALDALRGGSAERAERSSRRGKAVTFDRGSAASDVRSREPHHDLGSEVLSLAAALDSGETARRPRRS